MTTLVPAESFAVCGDVSGDAKVTTADALAVLKKAVGQEPPLACDQCGSDCPGDLRFLLGEWLFQSDFDTVLEDRYDLFAVDDVNCAITGQDLDDGGIVFATEASDSGYDYALLDPADTYCDFFVFDRTGDNQVDGFDVLLDVNENGCGDPISGVMHTMIGDRVVAAMASVEPALPAGKTPGDRRLADAVSAGVVSADGAASANGLDPQLTRLLDRMRALSAARHPH